MKQYEELYIAADNFLAEEKLNAFKIYEWHSLLSADEFKVEKYDELILYLSVNAFQTIMGFSSVEPPRFVACLQKEVYNALINESNRGKADLLLSSTISGIGAIVASQFDMNPFVVGGFLNLILVSVSKIGVDAWCHYYENKIKDQEETSE